jgi:hypothetical protein
MVARGSAVISTVYKLRFIPLDPFSFSCCALSVACTRKRVDRLMSESIDTPSEKERMLRHSFESVLVPEEDSSLKVDEMFIRCSNDEYSLAMLPGRGGGSWKFRLGIALAPDFSLARRRSRGDRHRAH